MTLTMHVLFVVLALLLSAAQAASRRPNARPQQKNTKSEMQLPVPSPPPVPQCSPAATPDTKATKSQPIEWYVRWNVWPIEWSNWALVIAAIWAGCIALSTLGQIRRQSKATEDAAKAAQDSANAALLNAQAVINSDRPWIYIIAKHSNSSQAYGFVAGNDGRTPAEVISYSCGFRCVESIKDLPDEPVYGPEIVPTIKLLVAEIKELDAALELMSFEEFAKHFISCGKTLDPTQHALIGGPKMSVFYFRVIYASPLKRLGADMPNYETRMCFCYSPSAKKPLSVCGNDNYNRHT